jgi:hypothetical protein
VALDRARADVQQLGDLLGRVRLGDQLDDLALARGQGRVLVLEVRALPERGTEVRLDLWPSR